MLESVKKNYKDKTFAAYMVMTRNAFDALAMFISQSIICFDPKAKVRSVRHPISRSQ